MNKQDAIELIEMIETIKKVNDLVVDDIKSTSTVRIIKRLEARISKLESKIDLIASLMPGNADAFHTAYLLEETKEWKGLL